MAVPKTLLLGGLALGLAPIALRGLANQSGGEGVSGLTGEGLRGDVRRIINDPGPQAAQLRVQRIRRMMQANEARLAYFRPDLYQSLGSGLKLNPFEVMISPLTRRDLVAEATFAMSTEQPPQEGADESLNFLLGG